MNTLSIGIPREIMDHEARVAATPETVARMTGTGAQVRIEAGAGEGSFIADAAYREAGALIVPDAETVYAESEVILKVKEPRMNARTGTHEIDRLRAGQTLICFLHPASPRNHAMIRRLAQRGVTALTLDGVPRMAKTQAMDALSSMSMVAGYKGVLMAADALAKFVPLAGSAVGVVPPASALVVGAGVAGLQALATAKRLGATVAAAEIRPEGREQAGSLGVALVDTGVPEELAIGPGGYAKALSEEWLERERAALRPAITTADIVILTALVPGRVAPILVTRDMLAAMNPGSVVVDISIDQGGNCEATEPGQTIQCDGVTVIGLQNIPGHLPVTATWLFARNILNYLTHLVRNDRIDIDRSDEVVASSLVTWEGEVVHTGTLEAMSAPAAGDPA